MRQVTRFRLLSLLLGISLAGPLAGSASQAGENWPTWRGPKLDGMSDAKHIPTKWSETENVLWKLALPGEAGASPIVWGDKIFLTSVDGEKLLLMCIGTDGKERWKLPVGTGNKKARGDEGNSASPSPSTDGKYVYAFFGDGSLVCADMDGKEVWKVDVQKKFGKFSIQFGMSSTPVLHGDLLYLQLIHSGGAKVVALNKNTGEQVWVQARKSDARAECEHSYASPMLYDDGKTSFLLSHGADYIIAHDLKDGTEIWRCGGLHPSSGYDPTLRLVASPLAVPGMIIVPSAKRGFLLALKPDGTGDVTTQAKAHWWKFDTTPDVPSPLVYDGLVYLCRENGNLICLDAKTGEKYYEQPTQRQRHRASPVYADGKIFLTARDGTVSVIKPGKTFELLSKNKLNDEISASPAIVAGRIYIRGFGSLYAIGAK